MRPMILPQLGDPEDERALQCWGTYAQSRLYDAYDSTRADERDGFTLEHFYAGWRHGATRRSETWRFFVLPKSRTGPWLTINEPAARAAWEQWCGEIGLDPYANNLAHEAFWCGVQMARCEPHDWTVREKVTQVHELVLPAGYTATVSVSDGFPVRWSVVAKGKRGAAGSLPAGTEPRTARNCAIAAYALLAQIESLEAGTHLGIIEQDG